MASKRAVIRIWKTIPKKYLLVETATSEYSERTKLNIKDYDGTLIILPSKEIEITDGTILTIKEVEKTNKPHLIIYLSEKPRVVLISKWITTNNISTLNIAGPRESQNPGIYSKSYLFLEKIFLAEKSSLTERHV